MKRTDMVVCGDSWQVHTEIPPQINWMQPEEKAVTVVNEIIVPTSTIVYIQRNFCELIHDHTICIDRFLDECRGVKEYFFEVELITDVALCENTLGNGPRAGNVCERETY